MIEKSDQEIIEELRNLSSLSIKQITTLFKFFNMYACMAYVANEKVHIPYFGSFYLKYDGEEITDSGKEAQVTGFFSPHDDLKKMIGQTEDALKKNDKESFININVVKYLRQNIEQIIRSEIE